MVCIRTGNPNPLIFGPQSENCNFKGGYQDFEEKNPYKSVYLNKIF